MSITSDSEQVKVDLLPFRTLKWIISMEVNEAKSGVDYKGFVMRADRNNGQIYDDFWDWLRNDGHLVWIISLVFAYAAYILTTEDV